MNTNKSESTKQKFYSVMTGDLVASRKYQNDGQQSIVRILTRMEEKFQHAFPDTVAHHISIFRGDSWQIVIKEPCLALRIAFFSRAFLLSNSDDKNLETRIGIGIGPIDYLPEDNVSAGMGEAFRLSGLALDQIGRNRYLHFKSGNQVQDDYINVLLSLADTISDKWSSAQARAVYGALQHKKQKDIARLWEPAISQQSVTRHLQRAGWKSIEKSLDWFEQITFDK